MNEWLWPLLFIAAYLVLMRWVLPRLGVPTWMVNSCRVESRRESREGRTNQAMNEGADRNSMKSGTPR